MRGPHKPGSAQRRSVGGAVHSVPARDGLPLRSTNRPSGAGNGCVRELPVENRRTFVLWISRPPVAANQARLVLEGHLEEVDTGRELRFRSAEELVSLSPI